MTAFEECQQCLAEVSATSVRFRPKTEGPILLLRRMADSAAGLSRDQLLQLRERIDLPLSSKLLYIGVLAAEKCINTRDVGWLRASVFAHVLEGFKFDYRENYLRLYASEYAGWRVGFEMPAVVDRFSALLDVLERSRFAGVFNEPHHDHALIMAQLKAIEVDGEFRFAAMD